MCRAQRKVKMQGPLLRTEEFQGKSQVVQWLRLCVPNAGSLGSIPRQGTRSHMLQWRLKILHVATKAWHSQLKISKYYKRRGISRWWPQNFKPNVGPFWAQRPCVTIWASWHPLPPATHPLKPGLPLPSHRPQILTPGLSLLGASTAPQLISVVSFLLVSLPVSSPDGAFPEGPPPPCFPLTA